MKINLWNKISFCFVVIMITACSKSKIVNSQEFGISQVLPDHIDFNFHIKPILTDRCFKCHGPDENKREAGLRLDTYEGAMAAIGKKLDHFAIVPGDVKSSVLIDRIFTSDLDDVMPPPESNLTLSNFEKKLLTKWIEQGAEWKKHWAFIAPENKVPHVVDELNFVKNDIDKFILAKLQSKNLPASPPAEKEYLVRRLALDLTGLPPDPIDVNEIESNKNSDWIETYVDKLLATDAYAERMTADWLDLARYSDTHGYQDDLERIMWPWRDWVIHAFKENMPYDQFVLWQLAGDLLPNPTREMIVATAFNRNHKITQEGGVIPEEYRVEYVSDRTQTFGTAFLGLSVECAKCHDHKYDPISQKDYYSLFAFFNSVPEAGLIPRYGAVPEPFIELTDTEISEQLTFINNVDTMKKIPLLIMKEMPEPRASFVLSRGAYDNPTTRVYPTMPEAILKFDENLPQNRLGLAQWLFDPQNPLTARVTANRIWQIIFGKGIVSTSYDFGNQGSLPSHPALLDHLALKLIDLNWDLKAFIKYIVLSGTYQQSSKRDEFLSSVDYENIYLARSNRKRMSAEMIRDQALAASGLLKRIIGGPSVKPYQPAGIWEEKTGGGGGSTAKYVQGEGDDLYRRSIYTFWKRTVPPPSLMTFDAASRDFCIVKRQSTSTPLQALVLLHDPQIVEASRVLAYNELSVNSDPKEAIGSIFKKITNRKINEAELNTLFELFQENQKLFDSEPEKIKDFLKIGSFVIENPGDEKILAAITSVTLTIFNLDESICIS